VTFNQNEYDVNSMLGPEITLKCIYVNQKVLKRSILHNTSVYSIRIVFNFLTFLPFHSVTKTVLSK
jgi:hypothetical protein